MSRSLMVCPDCKTPVSPKQPNAKGWNGNTYTCQGCQKRLTPNQFATMRDMTIARGGGAPLGGQSPATGIGRVALGTASGTASGASITLLTNVALAAGDGLLLFIAYDPTPSSAISTITWNGNPMTVDGTIVNTVLGGSAGILDCFVLENAPAGSGSIVVDLSVTGALAAWAAFATRITNANATLKDRAKTNGGTSASPSSTATLATLHNNELLVGAVAWANAAISGSWSNNFTAGQSASDGAGFSIEEGFRIVSAKATYTAAKSGATNTDWAAGIFTCREA